MPAINSSKKINIIVITLLCVGLLAFLSYTFLIQTEEKTIEPFVTQNQTQSPEASLSTFSQILYTKQMKNRAPLANPNNQDIDPPGLDHTLTALKHSKQPSLAYPTNPDTDPLGLDRILTALKLSKEERLTYEYLFLFGPISVARAQSNGNLPSRLTVNSFESAAKDLVKKGYLKEESGRYSTTGLTFLIEITSKKPELQEIHNELVNWEQLSIEKTGKPKQNN